MHCAVLNFTGQAVTYTPVSRPPRVRLVTFVSLPNRQYRARWLFQQGYVISLDITESSRLFPISRPVKCTAPLRSTFFLPPSRFRTNFRSFRALSKSHCTLSDNTSVVSSAACRIAPPQLVVTSIILEWRCTSSIAPTCCIYECCRSNDIYLNKQPPPGSVNARTVRRRS